MSVARTVPLSAAAQLAGAAPVRISQSLGAGSQGCRLDADGLERAVALSARVLLAWPLAAMAFTNSCTS